MKNRTGFPRPDVQPPSTLSALGPVDQRVSFFRNIKATEPEGNLTIRDLLERIRSGSYKSAIARVREASPERQQQVKASVLPAFIPSGCFSKRAKEGLLEHSGLFVLDIDDKTDPDGYKTKLAQDPHVLAAFASPRGGVKALVCAALVDAGTNELRVPTNGDEHKAVMNKLFERFDDLRPDRSGSDVARLCYVSHDPTLYVNEDAKPLGVELGRPAAAPVAPSSPQTQTARQVEVESIIPVGKQYNTLAQLLGAVRRLGFGESFLVSLARHVYDYHLEDPNDWYKVEKLACDLAQKSVELDTSAEAMARRAAASMRKAGLEDSPPQLPWIPFPVEVLPKPVRKYVRAHAAAINTDPAFIAVPALAVLASAVGNAYRIAPKRSWTEISAVWMVTVAPSGSSKSPGWKAAHKPVFELEREAKARFDEEKAAYDKLTSEQKKETPPPRRRRYRTSDTTIESLVAVHAQNLRGLMNCRDEFSATLGSFDKYSGGSTDLQAWIDMHGGRPIVVDRKSSDTPVLHLDAPHVCIASTIQPGVLKSRLGTLHLESGFAARLLLAEPPVRKRGWSDADVAPEVDGAYQALIRHLYALPINSGTLELSSEAKEAFRAYVNENGEKQHMLPDGPLKSALSKHEALALRFALSLHLADHVARLGKVDIAAPSPVSTDAMRRGIHLARWFRYETARLYQKYGFEQLAINRDAQLAARLPATFTWSEVAALWDVKRSGAYKVIERLFKKKLAEDAGHGRYRRLEPAEASGGFVDFGDFENVDTTASGDAQGQGAEGDHEATGTQDATAPQSVIDERNADLDISLVDLVRRDFHQDSNSEPSRRPPAV